MIKYFYSIDSKSDGAAVMSSFSVADKDGIARLLRKTFLRTWGSTTLVARLADPTKRYVGNIYSLHTQMMNHVSSTLKKNSVVDVSLGSKMFRCDGDQVNFTFTSDPFSTDAKLVSGFCQQHPIPLVVDSAVLRVFVNDSERHVSIPDSVYTLNDFVDFAQGRVFPADCNAHVDLSVDQEFSATVTSVGVARFHIVELCSMTTRLSISYDAPEDVVNPGGVVDLT